jgi:DNA repair ATPase RecN
MTMSTSHVDEFLKAEDEAHRLVEELTKLKAETESYASARGALTEVIVSVSDSSGKLSELAKRLGNVVEAMRSIGTPELLRAQDALIGQVKALGEDVNQTKMSVSTTLAGAMNEVRALRDRLDAGDAARQSEAKRFQSDLVARLESAQIDIKTLRRRIIGGIFVLAAVLVTLAVAVLVVGRV